MISFVLCILCYIHTPWCLVLRLMSAMGLIQERQGIGHDGSVPCQAGKFGEIKGIVIGNNYLLTNWYLCKVYVVPYWAG